MRRWSIWGMTMLFFAAPATAAEEQSAVRSGRLPNGFQYSIERRASPPAMAEMVFVLRAGRAAEEADQVDYAHLLEHLLIAEAGAGAGLGTKGPALLGSWTPARSASWNVGGANADVVQKRTSVVLPLDLRKSGGSTKPLEIVRSYFDFAYSKEQLEASSRAIIEEARGMPDAEAAIEAELDNMVGSQTGIHSKFAMTRSMENVSLPRLKDFHQKWFRPDLAEIHISGDVEPAAVEADIRRLFSDIAKDGALPQLALPANVEAFRFAMVRSTAQPRNIITIDWEKPKAVHPSDRLLGDKVAAAAMASVISNRLRAFSRNYDPLADAMFVSPIDLDNEKYSFTATIGDCQSGKIALCLETVNGVLWQVARDGPSDGELEAALVEARNAAARAGSMNAMARLKAQARGRLSADGALAPVAVDSSRVRALFAHWLKEAPITVRVRGRADERPMRSDEARAYFAPSTADRVAGAGVTLRKPSDLAVPRSLALSDISIRWDHKDTGSIAKVSSGHAGPLHILFANSTAASAGVSVNALRQPGFALLQPHEKWNAKSLGQAIRLNGMGGLDMFELEDWQAEHGVNALLTVSNFAAALQVNAVSADTDRLDDLVGMVAAHFAPLEMRPEALRYWRRTGAMSPSPWEINLGVDAAASQIPDGPALRAVHDRIFGDPGRFVFAVSGITDPKARELLAARLGGALLPRAKTGAVFASASFEPLPIGRRDIEGSERDQASVRIDIAAPASEAHSLDPTLDMAISAIVNQRVALRLREKENGVYAATYNFLLRGAVGARHSSVEFNCAPANVDRLIAATFDELERFAATGPTDDELAAVRAAVAGAAIGPGQAEIYLATGGQLEFAPVRADAVTKALIEGRIAGTLERRNAAILVVGPPTTKGEATADGNLAPRVGAGE